MNTLIILFVFIDCTSQELTQGLGAAGIKPPNRNFKDTDFVGAITLSVSRDLSFSLNQPLESADDLVIRILKNKKT